jgi:hypothetical protein
LADLLVALAEALPRPPFPLPDMMKFLGEIDDVYRSCTAKLFFREHTFRPGRDLPPPGRDQKRLTSNMSTVTIG